MTTNNDNRNQFIFWFLLFMISLLMMFSGYSQIHIKDNQSFHLAIGNDGVEIESSRNLYIRAGLNTEKAIGALGINISDGYQDQWVNHFALRLGKLLKEPTAVFGLEYGVDKKINDNFFIGGRIYNDWDSNVTGTESKLGFGIRIGFYL